LAFTKKHKNAMLAQYEEWLQKSQGVFMLTYTKMSMKEVDNVRSKAREAGGQAHVVKNTLMEIALKEAGIESEPLTGTTLVGFALSDAPALAKAFTDILKADKAETFKLKGGYLAKHSITASQVKELADLPPLPVMRARILGMINAPASQLARTIAEPARGLAAVVKAHTEQEPIPAEA
jgi:large subunit ribosomal protein L10